MIRVINVSKSYGKNKVLDGIDLTLEKGKVYGVVGKNGAGKSTLFRCLAGLESYDGDIESDYPNLRNASGLLETNPRFLTRITGWEYLKLFCIAREINDEDFTSQNIFELPLQEYAEYYSTGMKKKLALTAILLQKNEVYILDEPFNGVDLESNMLIGAIIDELKRLGKTVIISSHIFSSLKTYCDEMFLMKNGSIYKSVTKDIFEELEKEMKNDKIIERLRNLNL